MYGEWAKNLNLAQNLGHLMKNLCKVIPSYAKKVVQTHCHENTTKLLKVLKIKQNQAF